MKKLFSLCLICLVALSAMAQNQNVNITVIGGDSSSDSGIYVDLGLPSGTLWKKQNESGYYTYEEALECFGSQLPEWHHFVELQNECQWIWVKNYGYKVIGANGNMITLPAAGSRDSMGNIYNVGSHGYYWSSTEYNSNSADILYFNYNEVFKLGNFSRNNGISVRLVQ